jgi:hypothetical protein
MHDYGDLAMRWMVSKPEQYAETSYPGGHPRCTSAGVTGPEDLERTRKMSIGLTANSRSFYAIDLYHRHFSSVYNELE